MALSLASRTESALANIPTTRGLAYATRETRPEALIFSRRSSGQCRKVPRDIRWDTHPNVCWSFGLSGACLLPAALAATSCHGANPAGAESVGNLDGSGSFSLSSSLSSQGMNHLCCQTPELSTKFPVLYSVFYEINTALGGTWD